MIHGHKPKLVGALAPGMIHALSNFANNIILTAGILQEDYAELPEEERLEMIDSLVEESERAQKVLQRFRDFVAESKGESEAEFRPHDVRDIVEDALQLSANKLKRGKVKVTREMAADPLTISCGRHQLEEVFVNIALNAVDAMPDGGTLTVACKADGGFVQIEFSDTGTGIPDEIIGKIFQPFFTTRPAHESNGLGLYISNEIINLHGGDLSAKSDSPQGSTITVQLPAVGD